MLGETQLLAFRRLGKKVAVVFENPKFRASGDAAAQHGATVDFPVTIVTMLDVAAEVPGGGVVVNFAPFLLHDTINIAGALNEGGKGFKAVDALSAVDPSSVKVFPDNIEVDAVQTYASDTPGREIDTIAPDGRQVSFTVHHSLIRLPGPGFQTRCFDIRSGTHGTGVYDFNTPLGDDVFLQLANHFRLEKVDPGAARSPVKKPIMFWIDNAAPEPIRTALIEGVGWWNQAFDAAGYVDAFQAKVLPAGADPADVRYNMVNWDERLTRSWSYGGGIIDPRTGEIVKGNVVLEGLRLRQDIIIFHGLVGAGQDGSGATNDPVRVALARIRQLGAHEVGHALGFVHNFEGSTQDRTSVMDYPFARIGLKGGFIDLSDAYAAGIGTWDKYQVDWLYGQPKPGRDTDGEARRKADAAVAAGMRYMTDVDGRADDLAVPGDNMWTYGADRAPDLAHMLAVRCVALANFGPGVLHPGAPLSDLRRTFVPLWLLHRYEVVAVSKLLGGVDYHYALAGDGTPAPHSVSAAEQNNALDALLETLSARELTVPGTLTLMLSSGVNGRADPQFDTEVFGNAGGAVFDPLVAAEVAAEITLDQLLAPTRLRRLAIQHDRDPQLPGVSDLLDRLTARVIDHHEGAVARRIATRATLAIAAAARDPATAPEIALALEEHLRMLVGRLAGSQGTGEESIWSRSMAMLLRDPDALTRALHRPAPPIPAGMPI